MAKRGHKAIRRNKLSAGTEIRRDSTDTMKTNIFERMPRRTSQIIGFGNYGAKRYPRNGSSPAPLCISSSCQCDSKTLRL